LSFTIKESQGIPYRYLQGSYSCAILQELASGFPSVGQLEQSLDHLSSWYLGDTEAERKSNGILGYYTMATADIGARLDADRSGAPSTRSIVTVSDRAQCQYLRCSVLNVPYR